MSPDLAASIKARLLHKAREKREEFELVLVRYACERFLYRLGISRLRDRCILKGAGLLTLWMKEPYRSTRDLDFLASGPDDEKNIRATVEAICAVACPEDGLTFDLSSLGISPIRAQEKYKGHRAVFQARLGKAKIRLQIDFGFGDAVTPGPEEAEFSTLLPGAPAPRVRVYPRTVTVAEKFEAMVRLGRANSRMKDFHDVWALSTEFEFAGGQLRDAIAATFERRGTAWTAEPPDVLGSGFYEDDEFQTRWAAYLRTGISRAPSTAFPQIGDRIRAFLGPIRDSIVAGSPFTMRWEVGGPWR